MVRDRHRARNLDDREEVPCKKSTRNTPIEDDLVVQSRLYGERDSGFGTKLQRTPV